MRASLGACSGVAVLAEHGPQRSPEPGRSSVAQRCREVLYLGAQERPGDAIVYPGAYIPPWSLAFPRQFGRLRDLSLGQTASAAGQLYGRTVPRAALRPRPGQH
jgi:hypothetical protein